MQVNEVMTKDVVSLDQGDTITEAVEKLAYKKISGAPVLDMDGSLVGMLSEKDIINAMEMRFKRMEMVYPSLSMVSVSFIEKFEDKEVVEAFTEIAETNVADLMRTEPFTLDSEATINQAIDLMSRRSINRTPVMKGDKLVGIVTRKDIIRGLADSTNGLV